mgnify:CR=1 FL=1
MGARKGWEGGEGGGREQEGEARGGERNGVTREVLGEAGTGGIDGHNAGLEAGSRSWSMERDTKGGPWGRDFETAQKATERERD